MLCFLPFDNLSFSFIVSIDECLIGQISLPSFRRCSFHRLIISFMNEEIASDIKVGSLLFISLSFIIIREYLKKIKVRFLRFRFSFLFF